MKKPETVFNKSYFDTDNRIKKYQQIISILQTQIPIDHFKELKCLDIGCATGIGSRFLSKYFNKVVGIDTNLEAIEVARQSIDSNKLNFLHLRDEIKPFPVEDEYFDIVISNGVLMYVKERDFHLNEIRRVLKGAGVCYLSCNNRFRITCKKEFGVLHWIFWLPHEIVEKYIHFRKINIDQPPLNWLPSYYQLSDLLKKYFKVIHITPEIFCNGKKYGFFVPRFLSYFPKTIVNMLSCFTDTFIFILKKK